MPSTRTHALIAAALITCFVTHAVIADPLHKVGQEGAWQHEQSGWIFPKQVGEFTRVGAPYEIDGSYDVGARYEKVVNGVRTTAAVHVYATDSASRDASIAEAKLAAARTPSGAVAQLQSEEPFPIAALPASTGTKITYVSDPVTKKPNMALYFIETDSWIVNIRTTDGAASSAEADEFVRDLEWKTLGIAPGDPHAANPTT